jgi:hypothetical protein
MKADTRVEDPIEYGEFTPGQGTRQDLLSVKRKIDQGNLIEDLVFEDGHFSTILRNQRALSWYQTLKIARQVPKERPELWVITGPSQVGKTYFAKDQGPWYSPTDRGWWNGYQGEPNIIFDEFTGSTMSMELFNKYFDRTITQVDIKGTMGILLAQRFIFTSNREPSTWWAAKKPDEVGAYFSAFIKRVTKWVHFYEYKKFKETNDYETYLSWKFANM